MATNGPDALILDDGELHDVRQRLDQLGALYGTEGDEAAFIEVPLLITSLTRARQLHEAGHPLPKHALHLVIADADDQDLRGALGGATCDFIVRRPVEAAILALITRRSAYHGPERRRVLRVAIGTPVHVRPMGSDMSEPAILAQLSIAGCGLVTPLPLPEGRLHLTFPAELTKPRTLALNARAVRSREVPTADGLVYDTSVVFEDLGLAERVTLRAMMAGQPIDFRPDAAPPLRRGPMPGAAAERRTQPRRPFPEPSLSGMSQSGWTRVLIGRDISHAGMRVDREPDLALGDCVHLALYASDVEQPVLLDATVRRDDGQDGWYLEFDLHDRGAKIQLENLLGELERTRATDGTPIWVVSEVLEDT